MTMTSLPRRFSKAWLLCAAALILPGAASESGVPLEKNRTRIQNKSLHERLRVQENQRRFESLPASERERLRKLHRDLQALGEDERRGLEEQMVRYLGWLDTLPPRDRQSLDEIEDPVKRVDAVEKRIAEQRQRLRRDLLRLDEEHPPRSDDEISTFERRRRQNDVELSRLEKALRPKLSDDDKRMLAAIDDSEISRRRRFPIAILLADQYDVPTPEALDWVRGFTYGGIYSELQLERRYGERNIANLPAEDQTEARTLMLQFLTLPEVPQETLLQHYETLDENERYQMRSSGRGFWHFLRTSYYRKHAEKAPEELRSVLTKAKKSQSSSPRQPPRRKDEKRDSSGGRRRSGPR